MEVEVKYKTHEVAKMLGIPISTLKHYETIGKFPPPRRDRRGWRYYTQEDVMKLKAYFVKNTPSSPR